MTPAALPADESERLRILHELRILDSEPEECFDAAVRLVTRLMNCPIAMISLVDAERQWFKAVHGMETRQTPRDHAFCAHAILGADVLKIDHLPEDPRFADAMFVTGEPC